MSCSCEGSKPDTKVAIQEWSRQARALYFSVKNNLFVITKQVQNKHLQVLVLVVCRLVASLMYSLV